MDGAVARGLETHLGPVRGRKQEDRPWMFLQRTLSPQGFTPCGGSAVGETELVLGRVRSPQWLACGLVWPHSGVFSSRSR